MKSQRHLAGMRAHLVAAMCALALLASCGGGGDERQPLTLEQKIGHLVMMGVDGSSPDAPGVREAIDQVRAGQLGGIILYRYNVAGPAQVRQLTASFEGANPLPWPLLIGLDQEGGLVQRLRASNGFIDTPSHEDVAAQQSPRQAYETWLRMARMVADAGFNFNFGPVVDLRVTRTIRALPRSRRSSGSSSARSPTIRKSSCAMPRSSFRRIAMQAC